MFNEGLTYITLPIEFAFAKCELTQNIPSSRDVVFLNQILSKTEFI